MLDFRQAPPLSIPLRFMLTAPLFGLAGAALLLWAGDQALHSRWQPVTLAALHCFTVGLMLQAMIGALWQVLPVVGGVALARVRLTATLVHLGLSAGALLLVLGLSGWPPQAPRLLEAGALLLVLAIGVLLWAVVPGLAATRLRTDSQRLLALAALGLAVAGATGLAAALMLAGQVSAGDFTGWVDLHASWALGGWALALVGAVALPFVPMFYMTPAFPPYARAYTASLLVALLACSAGLWAGRAVALAGALLLLAAAAAFALAALSMFARRRRPRGDATLLGWRLAMASMLAAALLFVARAIAGPGALGDALAVAFGVQAVLGVFVTLIGAMLLRIVPFLASLHIAALGGGWRLQGAPGDTAQRAQLWLQGAAAAALALAAAVPALARPAAALLLVSQLLLARNVWAYGLALRSAFRKAGAAA